MEGLQKSKRGASTLLSQSAAAPPWPQQPSVRRLRGRVLSVGGMRHEGALAVDDAVAGFDVRVAALRVDGRRTRLPAVDLGVQKVHARARIRLERVVVVACSHTSVSAASPSHRHVGNARTHWLPRRRAEHA